MGKASIFFLVAACIGVCRAMAQCAMCRAIVQSNTQEGGSGLGAGLNTGILYLLVIPYLAVLVGLLFWYRSRKMRGKPENL